MPTRAPARRLLLLTVTLLLTTWLLGCKRPMKVPGESDITVSEVTLKSSDAEKKLTAEYGPLIDRLGMRTKTLVLPGRYYSEFREAEDRRRIIAFWQQMGFFDVEVAEPETVFDDEEGSVAITWTITENERYTLKRVELLHAPQEHEAALREMIFFGAGHEDIDFEKYRYVRRDMADHLRRAGHGHARVYTRAFIDRQNQVIHWFFYVDEGPKTRVGKIVVEGNNKIPADLIIERSGLAVGEPYDWNKRYDGEFHLLDTGAFASSFVRADVDTKFHVPGDAPDTGGVIKDEQVDEEGNLKPRELPEDIDVKIHVVEAPSQQLRVRAGAEFDPTRVDTVLSSQLWLRNLFGPWHHVVMEGRIGYGWLWSDTSDDPAGLYGEGLIRYIKPMAFGRLGDFRLTTRFRDELFPGFHFREFTAGPGVHVSISPGRAKNHHGGGLFFDLDLLFRWGQQVDFGPFDDATRDAFTLPDEDISIGEELQASLVWDERDNQLEALRGHLLALRTTFNPGLPISTHRYLTLSPEARGFVPLTESFSVGVKGVGNWVVGADDDAGVPLGPRLFGGGAWGHRGFGRHRLSPYAPRCIDSNGAVVVCQGEPVGGLSMVEASLEGRLLPKLKTYGAVIFADVGGVGSEANPFENGVSLAAGLGLRLRFWYLPAALDFSYRILEDNEVQGPEHDPFLVFFRLGEAF
jgi:outer membrane translocation and assembly module TamA